MKAEKADTDALDRYLPSGCTCTGDSTSCARCVAQRERIRRLYAATKEKA